ncbi:hypothetical protein QO004_002836 [Rhizobium mesoamericanum]|nr:hypothetical protein [Rhizobium mesoamericanum]
MEFAKYRLLCQFRIVIGHVGQNIRLRNITDNALRSKGDTGPADPNHLVPEAACCLGISINTDPW